MAATLRSQCPTLARHGSKVAMQGYNSTDRPELIRSSRLTRATAKQRVREAPGSTPGGRSVGPTRYTLFNCGQIPASHEVRRRQCVNVVNPHERSIAHPAVHPSPLQNHPLQAEGHQIQTVRQPLAPATAEYGLEYRLVSAGSSSSQPRGLRESLFGQATDGAGPVAWDSGSQVCELGAETTDTSATKCLLRVCDCRAIRTHRRWLVLR